MCVYMVTYSHTKFACVYVYLHICRPSLHVCEYIYTYFHAEFACVCVYIYTYASRVYVCVCVYMYICTPSSHVPCGLSQRLSPDSKDAKHAYKAEFPLFATNRADHPVWNQKGGDPGGASCKWQTLTRLQCYPALT